MKYFLLIAMLLFTINIAFAVNITDDHGNVLSDTGTQSDYFGMTVTANYTQYLRYVNKSSFSGATKAYIFNTTNGDLLQTIVFNGLKAEIVGDLVFKQGDNYSVLAGNDLANYQLSVAPGSPTIPKQQTGIKWLNRATYNGAFSDEPGVLNYYNIQSITTEFIQYEGLFSFISPTPPNDAVNNTQVIINVSCTLGGIDLFFGNETNPSTLVIDEGGLNAEYTTSVTESGTYYYKGSCNNGTTNSSIRSWTYDDTGPSIILNPTNYFNASNQTINSSSENLFFNYTATDNIDLFATQINVSLDGIQYMLYTNSTLSGTEMTIINYTSMYNWPNGVYDVIILASDSHTAQLIGDYKPRESMSTLEFNTAEGLNIRIESQERATTKAIKQFDRYKFEFEFDDKVTKTRIYDIYCDGKLYEKDTKYAGHLICSKDGITGNWIDFEGLEKRPQLNKVTDKHYQAIFQDHPSKAIFNSIGGLNVNTFNYQFELQRFGVDNCTSYNVTAMNITFYDPSTAPINVTLLGNLIFPGGQFLIPSRSASSQKFCIYPENVGVPVNLSLRFSDTYTTYNYYISEANLTSNLQDIFLYTQGNNTYQCLISVFDTGSDPLADVYIEVLKQDIAQNSFTTTEILKTDSSGNALGNFELGTSYYRMILERDGSVAYTDSSSLMVPSSNCEYLCCKNFYLTGTGETWFTNAETTEGVLTSIEYQNSTNYFVFNWNDPSNLMHYACMDVTKYNISGRFGVSSSCTMSAAGTLYYSPAEETGARYEAKAYLKYDDIIPVGIAEKVFERLPASFRNSKLALFMSTALMGVLFFLGLFNPVLATFFMVVGIIAGYLLKILSLSLAGVATIVILWIIQEVVLKNR